jgi:hypothetical protein
VARTVLLIVYAVGWLTAVVISAINTKGDVPPELWALLGVGVGSILAAFRVDGLGVKPAPPPPPPPPAPQPNDGQ